MTATSNSISDTRPYWKAGLGAILVMAMTSLHHIYGAIVYDTPYRLHIVFIAVPFAAVIVALLSFSASRRGAAASRIAAWIAGVSILVFAVAMIGVFEGGYNHTIKDFVYFVLGEDVARGLCGAQSTCQMPDSFLFEASGIAQFVLAIPAAVWAWQLLAGQGR